MVDSTRNLDNSWKLSWFWTWSKPSDIDSGEWHTFQVFLIVHHAPLVRQLARIICNGNVAESADHHGSDAQVSFILYCKKTTMQPVL